MKWKLRLLDVLHRMSEEHIMGPSMSVCLSVAFFLTERQPAWRGHYCPVIVPLLQHIVVATVGSEVIVGAHCCATITLGHRSSTVTHRHCYATVGTEFIVGTRCATVISDYSLLVQQWPKDIVVIHCCSVMILDYISAKWPTCYAVKNTFVTLVYSNLVCSRFISLRWE
jgi:hypothetical protein